MRKSKEQRDQRRKEIEDAWLTQYYSHRPSMEPLCDHRGPKQTQNDPKPRKSAPAPTMRIAKRLIVMVNGRPSYDFGIFERTFNGHRLVAVLEGGVYADAQALLNAERTPTGHSFKGFKKLKDR